MYDKFNRKIDYLRISVTDRCNLRCVYCMPEEGIQLLDHRQILSFDEITQFTRLAVSKGVRKVRLTGGEPLVRKGIVSLVEMLSEIEGIEDLAMTTNGTLLEEYAFNLKKAGLRRVNISLDTLDPEYYSRITRGGKLKDVLRGIETALEAGLTPVKINCVIKKSHQEPHAQAVAAYAGEKKLEVRFIHQMNLDEGEFTVVEGGSGGDCAHCNRLRLTATGNVKPCLFNDLEYNIRELGSEEALRLAVEHKPRCGSVNHTSEFYNIGG